MGGIVVRHKKKLQIVLSLSLLLSLSFFIAGCSNSLSASELKKLPVSHLEGSFAINVDNPKETVGDADYVFLARVDQLVDTEYRYPVTIETANGTKEVTSPYTNYKVTVLKNIKGNLQTNTSMPITKSGGVDEDNASVILYEDDNLPVVKKIYVFLAYTQEDGTLLISGPNSNILVGNSDKTETISNLPSALKTSKIVSLYEDSTIKQIVKERKRFVSKYNANK